MEKGEPLNQKRGRKARIEMPERETKSVLPIVKTPVIPLSAMSLRLGNVPVMASLEQNRLDLQRILTSLSTSQ
jgi:hypothetical protein